MHIAASKPLALDRSQVATEIVDRERTIAAARAAESGKPANIVEQIVDGELEKFFSDKCLVDQTFIKNPDQTITQLVAEKSKALGDQLVIRRFLRYSVGEQLA